jgi:arylsulfatase A-like enzyme/tetratricopeptide (TPR) repeat protein
MKRALAVAVVMLGVACAPRSAPQSARASAKHLVLVTIDTLRADRVGVYGATTVATPNLDRLAREGALAFQATVPVPLTRPSHISLFTGLYPAEHGIRDNVSPPLASDVPVLAELLQHRGFTTAGFVSSIVLSKQSGLGRGFALYSDRFEIGEDDARFLNTIQRRGDVVVEEAVKWIAAGTPERKFAWVHLYDPHDPYEPPEPYASQYRDRPYDGEVAWSDELVGRLDAALAAAGMRENTLLVVTSDHGEGLEEHGEAVHGFFIYETTLRVPFIMRGPGIRPGTKVETLVRGVDVLPTVLDLLDLTEGTPAVSGRSVEPALNGVPMDDEPAFAESLTPLVHYGWSDLRALRDGRWKYILAPRPELYDLDIDPGELRNLAEREPARARALRAGLEERLRVERDRVRAPGNANASVPPDLLEKLGALGYVSPSGPATTLAAGADPKDKIAEYETVNRLMREGLINLREGRYAESLDRFTQLFARDIDSFEAHYYAGRALTGLKRWREAATHYEGAIAKLPTYSAAYLGLSEAHQASGNVKLALDALRRGQKAAPNDPQLVEREGDLARSMRNLALAATAFERVAQMAPQDALARVKLGEVYRDLGRPADAVRVIREAIKLDSSPASYWNSLGMILGGSGDLPGAEEAFRNAVSRDRGNAQYAYNLGLALARQGKRDEAASEFRRTLEIDPGFAAARQRLAELR